MPETSDDYHDRYIQYQAEKLFYHPDDIGQIQDAFQSPFEQKLRAIQQLFAQFSEEQKGRDLALELCVMPLYPDNHGPNKIDANSYEKTAKKTTENLDLLELEMAHSQLDFHRGMSGLLRLLNFYQRFHKDLSESFKKSFRPEIIMKTIEENLPMVLEKLSFMIKNPNVFGESRLREILTYFIEALIECLNALSPSLPQEKRDLRKNFNQQVLTIFGRYFPEIESYIRKQLEPTDKYTTSILWHDPYNQLLELGLGVPDNQIKELTLQRVQESIDGKIPNFDGLRVIANGGVSSIEGVADTLNKPTAKCFQKFGFTQKEAQALMKAWFAGTPVLEKGTQAKDEEFNKYKKTEQSIFWSNFKSMSRLESQRPGSPLLLHRRFGIKNFARYSAQVLLAQTEHCEDQTTPYGIVLAAEDDWNGAFTDLSLTTFSLYKQLESSHRLRIIECDSKGDALFKLATLHEIYGQTQKMSFAVITGHGSKDVLAIGNSHHLGEENAEFTSKDFDNPLYKLGAELFTPDATLVLDSCSTGKENGLSQKISQELQINVIGANENSKLRTIEAIPHQSEPEVTINVRFNGDGISRHYRKGKLTPSIEPDTAAHDEKYLRQLWCI